MPCYIISASQRVRVLLRSNVLLAHAIPRAVRERLQGGPIVSVETAHSQKTLWNELVGFSKVFLVAKAGIVRYVDRRLILL